MVSSTIARHPQSNEARLALGQSMAPEGGQAWF
jgi:hypothetical protein